jgi:SSS family solute:Na+ symporter
MAALDWCIVLVVLGGVIGVGLFTRRYMRSVADFLAAGRSAGRYLITISYGVANIGAITVLAFFEQNYEAGATLMWWEALLQVALLFAMLSGWVIYRFRQTRCLTLAEFFERRYGRGFRVFAGALAFVAGVLNFSIFPLVGSKFFVFFCGLPPELTVLGATIATHVPLMLFLLGVAIWFVFTGGQVSVLTTDFLQGVFANVVFVAVSVFLLVLVGWGEVSSVLSVSEPGHSRIDPFDTSAIQHFGILFFVISLIEVLYGQMSWQGEQAYYSSARTAHEARMGGILRLWFLQIRLVFFLAVPIVAYAILNSDAWTSVQLETDRQLATLTDPQDVGRFRVPVVLSLVLPVGLKGMMAAMMLAAFISTHNTYLHSWGSIFTQDVLLPVLGWKASGCCEALCSSWPALHSSTAHSSTVRPSRSCCTSRSPARFFSGGPARSSSAGSTGTGEPGVRRGPPRFSDQSSPSRAFCFNGPTISTRSQAGRSSGGSKEIESTPSPGRSRPTCPTARKRSV